MGKFSDWFLVNSPAISAAQNAHSQAVIFEVTKAIRAALDQLHFAVEPGFAWNVHFFVEALCPRL